MKRHYPQVLVRMRPSQSSFELSHQSNTITVPSNTHDKKDKVFEYNRVFSPQTTNQVLWEEGIKEGVDTLLEGRNLTLIAYGVTGSGKTHTIFGNEGEDGLASLIFKKLVSEYKQWEFGFSFYEIYNENIIDLLSEDRDVKLSIYQEKNKTFIANLTEKSVQEYSELKSMIQEGIERRSQSPTFMNERSSRSHAILQLTLQNTLSKTRSRVTVIDLAGSERTSPIDSSKQMMEGSSINKSLLALGNCLNVLSDSNKSGGYIPYRDSKLTRILKDSLSGNARLVMIACVSGNKAQLQQTVNTLTYASRASRIKWVSREREQTVCCCGLRQKLKESEKCIQSLERRIESLVKEIKIMDWRGVILQCQQILEKENMQSNIFDTSVIRRKMGSIIDQIKYYNTIQTNIISNFSVGSITLGDTNPHQKMIEMESRWESKKTSVNSLQETEQLPTERMRRDIDEGKRLIVIKPRVSALTLR